MLQLLKTSPVSRRRETPTVLKDEKLMEWKENKTNSLRAECSLNTRVLEAYLAMIMVQLYMTGRVMMNNQL